jgi:starch phosphorylase
MEKTGLSFDQVAPEIAESIVFTTHTPVEAGHDRFDPEKVLHLLKPLQKRLKLSDDELLAFGRVDPTDSEEQFCMSVLALKLSQRANGVSALHGMVSRRMWRSVWPERGASDIPIGHITNGVHTDTWIALEWVQFYRDCLGSDWRIHLCDPHRWRLMDQLDPLQLWGVKVALKQRLLHFLRRRQEERWRRLGLTEPMPELNLDALTIGFARRFASYKRALLLFEDMERIERLLTDPQRPVQVIFAGKAHPANEPGKAIIQRIVEIARDPKLRNHVVFVEDHDKNVSRHLLEGCDLWLNTPRRPLEACGTSGMKAVFNATLNCSVMDGWWDEAYNTKNGFAFGEGLVHVDPAVQDHRDAESLLTVLEAEVVPLFYERDERGIPTRWLERVKDAFRTLAWRYNSDRMVMDYAMRLYLDASKTFTAAIRH